MSDIRKINWHLYSNGVLEVNNSNKDCEIDESRLVYNEDGVINTIDFTEKYYERENSDTILKVDFVNNILSLYVKELHKTFDVNITSSFTKNENEIILEYSLEETKKILIQLL